MKFSYTTSSGVRLDIEITAWNEAMAPLDPDTPSSIANDHLAELLESLIVLRNTIRNAGFHPTPKI